MKRLRDIMTDDDDSYIESLSLMVSNLLPTGQSTTLSQFVTKLSEQEGKGVERAARDVYMLWERGAVELIDKEPPSSLFEYIKSGYATWFWALLFGVFITLASIFLLPQNAPFIYIRYIAGSISVLYFPGYTLIEALYSKKDELDQLERLALSIGLSLAVVPLIGLLLNYTPWGIRLIPIIISLVLFSLVMAVIACIRKFSYLKLPYMAREIEGKAKL